VTPPLEIPADELDLARWIRAGDGVLFNQACAEPVALVDRLIAQARGIGDLRVFCGLSWRDVLASPEAGALEIVSYGALGRLSRVAAQRPVRIVPCHFSALAALFERRELPIDIAIVQVSPPDPDGRCSFGVDPSYMADAIAHARVIIAEVNERMPATRGAWLDYDAIDVAVPSSRPLLEAPTGRATETDERIADRIAELIQDGDSIQIGVGALPEAILRRLRGARDLGIHSGMIGDAVVELVEAGVITGARKPADRGLVVTGAALGSRRLFDFLEGSEDVLMRPVSYTHSPATLAQVGRLVAINGGVEVDLSGQVNAEVAAGRHVGAVGGQVDFLRGAVASGGLGIVALPSVVAKTGATRIVPALSGPVTTARADVDLVVTEHGVARLRGLDLERRAAALIAVAAPEHRDELARAGGQRGGEAPIVSRR
jgi:acyl-CoA hydrolase